MFRTPWICARCTRQWLKPLRPLGLRRQSTAAATGITSDTIYPALLQRARKINSEHHDLAKQLESNYDSKIAKRAGELRLVVDALSSWDHANKSLEELRALLRDPETDAELRELANQDVEQCADDLQKASQSLTKSLIPKHPFADLPCLMEIRPGIGGKEAALFASDLVHMYQGFCADNRLSASLVSYERSEEDPNQLIEAIMEVESAGAYGLLRCEAGVHRVQRVPATEEKGRIHTSTASVMVLPSFSDNADAADIDMNDPTSDFYIDPKDIRKEYMRASGAGGQHVNKTESAVRLVHLPTKTTVFMQESRSRPSNETRAWSLLRAKLAHTRREAREQELVSMRRNVVGVNRTGRSDKIRTYNWQQQRVTDHRSGTTVHGLEGIMSGGQNLQKLMESARKWLTETEVEDMIADSTTTNSGSV
ncbi:release factor [Microthyrium microscopicum]|uniref:Release factor n=1 Tax=Microthyrium microscopicum TaxID=703497 RepID=A0A6A6URP6_9PEZI|nr:release factor [Microthyrium microscopicum]